MFTCFWNYWKQFPTKYLNRNNTQIDFWFSKMGIFHLNFHHCRWEHGFCNDCCSLATILFTLYFFYTEKIACIWPKLHYCWSGSTSEVGSRIILIAHKVCQTKMKTNISQWLILYVTVLQSTTEVLDQYSEEPTIYLWCAGFRQRGCSAVCYRSNLHGLLHYRWPQTGQGKPIRKEEKLYTTSKLEQKIIMYLKFQAFLEINAVSCFNYI